MGPADCRESPEQNPVRFSTASIQLGYSHSGGPRALDAYLHRAALWRKGDQLLVCYGPHKRGLPATKQTLSRWIVDAIHISFESSQLPSSMGVRAHSTQSVAASKDFLASVPIQDICNAVGWFMPLTFVRFYGPDMRATPGSSVLSLSSCS